jgi:hypothetical protein
MFLYIGDVWVDEVTSLGYSCDQIKTPIYGYASQLFDATAAGHVLVQGSFSINFKEQGYLWAVLRRYFSMGPGSPEIVAKGYSDPVDKRKAKKLISNKLQPGLDNKGGRPVIGSNGSFMSKGTIERISQGEATKSELNKFYHSLAGYSTFSVNSPKDKIFEDIVEAFEDEVWKTTDNDPLLSQIRRTDDNSFDDFDIYVSFGDQANKFANHTVSKIVGVRLTSQGKQISIGMGPVQETYQFIARTVV